MLFIKFEVNRVVHKVTVSKPCKRNGIDRLRPTGILGKIKTNYIKLKG
ncbi:hypothetical protein GCM10007978_22220 [Shewanella hanedai]|nr:hypothetical protein GCM10007978_22220 [Shewanella hanedai]